MWKYQYDEEYVQWWDSSLPYKFLTLEDEEAYARAIKHERH